MKQQPSSFNPQDQVPGIPVWETIPAEGETLYRVATADGLVVVLSSLGANLRSVIWQGREITLGYADPAMYRRNPAFLGATVGRFANRIANGRASVGGATLQLATNNGANHLHGGPTGFQVQPFGGSEIRGVISFRGQEYPARGVAFDLVSPDGHEGYPGSFTLRVSLLLAPQGHLVFHYRAQTTKPTLCNITNHTYWNLAGEGQTIHDHVLTMHCPAWMDAPGLIPNGTFVPLKGSCHDFSRPARLGGFLDPARDTVLPDGGKGVDHCFALSPDAEAAELSLLLETPDGAEIRSKRTLRLGAELSAAGLGMEVWTTKPGIQVYTQNFGDGSPARTGRVLSYRAVCLETQYFPDAPNQAETYRAWGREAGWSEADMAQWDARLEPGQTYEAITLHHWRHA